MPCDPGVLPGAASGSRTLAGSSEAAMPWDIFRSSSSLFVLSAVIALSLAPAPAAAQQSDEVIRPQAAGLMAANAESPARPRVNLFPVLLQSSPIDTLSHAVPVATQPALAVRSTVESRPSQAANVALCVSFAALEALDVHSTSRALGAGHREANPMMAGLTSNTAALIAVKAAAAGTVIAVDRKLLKKNRLAANILMVAANTASAIIVAHNYRVVTRR